MAPGEVTAHLLGFILLAIVGLCVLNGVLLAVWAWLVNRKG